MCVGGGPQAKWKGIEAAGRVGAGDILQSFTPLRIHGTHVTGSDTWLHGISFLALPLQSELDSSFLLGGLSGPHFLFLFLFAAVVLK